VLPPRCSTSSRRRAVPPPSARREALPREHHPAYPQPRRR
jgi:hypothetical protein